ncbi:MAG: T9SS type A sorting domain-containing protein, partial [Bacteroidota bacterium]
FSDIPAATFPSFTPTITADANGNQYRVIITDDNGTPNDNSDDCQVISNAATLTIIDTSCTGPTINIQPKDSATSIFGGADFSVNASGVGSLTYQWQVKTPQASTFSDIPAATFPSFTPTITADANGNQYRVIITDDNNTPSVFTDDCQVISNAATLTILGSSPGQIRITEFTLEDAETNTEVREIKDGDKLLLENVPPSFTIIAKVEGTKTADRVFLDLNGPVNNERTERRVPYAVFGDSRGDYSGRNPLAGTYDITAVPFYRDGSLMEGRPLTVNFEIIDCASSGPRANAGPDLEVGSFCTGTIPPLTANIAGGNGVVDFIWMLPDGTTSTEQTFVPRQFGFFTLTATDEVGCTSSDEALLDPCPTNCDPAVIRLVLVSSATNEDIMTIRNADVVDLSRVGRELNIRADLQCGETVESVKWELTGTQIRTRVENKAPYALAGDNNGNYSNQNFRPGSYTIEASPFNMKNAQGIMGAAALLNFIVINGTPAAQTGFSDPTTLPEKELSVYPVPASRELNIDMKFFDEGQYQADLFDAAGRVVLSQELTYDNIGGKRFKLNTQNIGVGIYMLRISGRSSYSWKKVFIRR